MDVEDIRQLLAEYEVKFIRLAFCDIFGRQKNIAIMADELEHALEHGVSFDASAIKGFLNISESDLLLFPDLDTFSILPWRPADRGVARFYCYITYPDRRPFEGDGRYLLSRIEKKSGLAGYSFLVGPECEFYLFETDEKGFPTLCPFDDAGYFDMAPLDRGENVRREICFALENMGIKPERSHHEHGPGQNEIDFRCSSPLKAADDMMTLLPREGGAALTEQVFNLPDHLTAPIKQGDVVGTVTLTIEGESIGTVDLIAGSDVSRNQMLYTISRVGEFFSSTYFKVVIMLTMAVVAVYAFIWVLSILGVWSRESEGK